MNVSPVFRADEWKTLRWAKLLSAGLWAQWTPAEFVASATEPTEGNPHQREAGSRMSHAHILKICIHCACSHNHQISVYCANTNSSNSGWVKKSQNYPVNVHGAFFKSYFKGAGPDASSHGCSLCVWPACTQCSCTSFDTLENKAAFISNSRMSDERHGKRFSPFISAKPRIIHFTALWWKPHFNICVCLTSAVKNISRSHTKWEVCWVGTTNYKNV